MPLAVIYARYSTNNQNPKSVDDQIVYCKNFLSRQKNDIRVVKTFHDRAVSGAEINRIGLDAMLDYLKSHDVAYVVVESIDRLSRSARDMHRLYEVIRFYGSDIFSVTEGVANDLLIGMKGTMNAIYRTDIAAKVARSHTVKAQEGLVPAGLAYGYKVKTDAVDENGKRLNGVREIIEEQAEVVRRIFEMYADGVGSKAIAQRLNIEGIPSPTGGYWVASTILGSRSKKSGILCNEIYRGKLVYNRSKKLSNPFTRRRELAIKPEKEWIAKDIPELRIVSEELWNRVQARYTAPLDTKTKKENVRSSSTKHLSGLVHCGVCGAKSQRANGERYVCGAYRSHKTCMNARGVTSTKIANELFTVLENYVSRAENLFDIFEKIYQKEKVGIEEKNEELSAIRQRIENYRSVIDDGVHLPEITKKLKELEYERAKLVSQMDTHIPQILSEEIIKKTLIEEGLSGLKDEFDDASFAQSWRVTMSLLVERVVTTPIPDKKKGMTIEVKIASIEGWAEFYRRITASRAHN